MNPEIDGFLAQYLDPFAPGSSGLAELRRRLSVEERGKGHILVEEGRHHPFAYYLLRGAVRSFYLKDGIEVNTWFAFEGEMVGSFQNYLGKTFPRREIEFRNFRVTRWQANPFSRGSYSFAPVGATAGDFAAIAEPAGRIRFAGEATIAAFQSTVHGAYLSNISFRSSLPWPRSTC